MLVTGKAILLLRRHGVGRGARRAARRGGRRRAVALAHAAAAAQARKGAQVCPLCLFAGLRAVSCVMLMPVRVGCTRKAASSRCAWRIARCCIKTLPHF